MFSSIKARRKGKRLPFPAKGFCRPRPQQPLVNRVFSRVPDTRGNPDLRGIPDIYLEYRG